MTTSLESQLAAALKRVDELERALVTFEALAETRDLVARLAVAESSLQHAWSQAEIFRDSAESLLNRCDGLQKHSAELQSALGSAEQHHREQMERMLKNVTDCRICQPYTRPLYLKDGRRVLHGLVDQETF
jgi:predicted  nucleic acid-binding Zn-ribbon protein